MAVSEASRREPHNRLADVMGPEVADVLMEHLPPTGWSDVATRADVDHLAQQLRSETALPGESLRHEMADLRSEMGRDMSALSREMSAQTRTLMLGLTGMVVAAFGAVAALVH